MTSTISTMLLSELRNKVQNKKLWKLPKQLLNILDEEMIRKSTGLSLEEVQKFKQTP